uniref:Uncharacterized protein n=1 Tax=Bartonella schoenbuchensis (strain DSM 13525 / NCTC 13165 / R1) TaxID=687861 RepID=E6Z1H4_BARSR|nr:hypothetical protein BARSC_190235 [Bartonella schoenbuchensis R1]
MSLKSGFTFKIVEHPLRLQKNFISPLNRHAPHVISTLANRFKPHTPVFLKTDFTFKIG